MSKFVSVLGKWIPAMETANMVNTFGKTIESEFIIGQDGTHVVKEGEKFIYKGPNREAVKMLKEMGEEHLGRDFREDPEFLQAVRNLGFNDKEQYLKSIGFDEEKSKKEQNDLALILDTVKNKAKTKEILEIAGGRDFTGNRENTAVGGFGPERVRRPDELTKSP